MNKHCFIGLKQQTKLIIDGECFEYISVKENGQSIKIEGDCNENRV